MIENNKFDTCACALSVSDLLESISFYHSMQEYTKLPCEMLITNTLLFNKVKLGVDQPTNQQKPTDPQNHFQSCSQ